jgi:hypothetical protein
MRKRIIAFLAIVALGLGSNVLTHLIQNDPMVCSLGYDMTGGFPETKLKRLTPAFKEANSYGFINHHGDLKIPARFADASHFQEGRAAVRIGSRWGYINTTGSIAVPIQLHRADDYSNGIAAVKVGRMWGYIDKQGKIVAKPQFNIAKPFSKNVALVNRANLWGLIDRKGALIFPCTADKFDEFSDGVARVCINQKYGFVREDGSWLCKPIYTELGEFSEGLGAFCENGKWGYMDKSGAIVLKPQFAHAGTFIQGAAAVKTEKNVSGIIDHHGQFLITPRFDGLARITPPTREGLASLCGSGLTPFAEPSGWGFARTDTGEPYIKAQFAEVEPFSEGMACVGIVTFKEH